MNSELINELLSVAARFGEREDTPVFLVGGSVRRMLSGAEFADLDFVVDATKGAIRLGDAIAKELPECLGPALISSFPTVELRCNDIVIQISEPLRKVTLDISGIDVPLSDAMKQDALRRDFTVNTLLVPAGKLDPSAVIDPLGCGISDLNNNILRTPLSPSVTIDNDPIRMLRAIRFSTVEGFGLDGELENAISSAAPKIMDMPGERINYELSKILTGPAPSEGIRLMQQAGILRYFLPELEKLGSVEQPTEFHFDDALSHTLSVLDRVEPDLTLRLAALFHDIGKEATCKDRDGRIVFHGHQYAGTTLTRKALRRLRYPTKTIDNVVHLVEAHMVAYRREWSDRAVRRLIRKAGESLGRLMQLYRADIAARKPPHNDLTEFEDLERRIGETNVEEIHDAQSPLNGKEVMKLLGLEECPEVGEAMRAVEKAIVDGKIPADKEAAKRFLLSDYLARQKGIS